MPRRLPDGKVYRSDPMASSRRFYDPKTKYIWALAFDSHGDLFVATGDEGEIHKVTPDGKGSVFFRTEETHARSLAIDSKDNLIVGTEPGGLILAYLSVRRWVRFVPDCAARGDERRGQRVRDHLCRGGRV